MRNLHRNYIPFVRGTAGRNNKICKWGRKEDLNLVGLLILGEGERRAGRKEGRSGRTNSKLGRKIHLSGRSHVSNDRTRDQVMRTRGRRSLLSHPRQNFSVSLPVISGRDRKEGQLFPPFTISTSLPPNPLVTNQSRHSFQIHTNLILVLNSRLFNTSSVHFILFTPK
jgi:hypothetical protein